MDKDRATGIIDKIWSLYGLKVHEAAVFAVLLFAADGTCECSMTVGEISEMCGRSKSSVRRAIRSLEERVFSSHPGRRNVRACNGHDPARRDRVRGMGNQSVCGGYVLTGKDEKLRKHTKTEDIFIF